MSRLPRFAGLALALLGVAALVGPDTRAQDDPKAIARKLRFMMVGGEFAEAGEMLSNAPDELRNDPKLRFSLGDNALRWVKLQKKGANLRPGLMAARENYAVARKIEPTDFEASVKALECSARLIEIEREEKLTDTALKHASWSVTHGEVALETEGAPSELKELLAVAYGLRAAFSPPHEQFDRIVGDYSKGAQLLAEIAPDAKKPYEVYGKAAGISLQLAKFVSETRPIPEEKRDDEAAKKALEYATLACESKGAKKEQYTQHLLALRAAKRMGIEGDLGKPYMREIEKRDGIDGLKLKVPMGDGWKRVPKAGDWDIFWERQLEGDDTAVQVMIKVWEFSQNWGGKTYDRVEDISKSRFDSKKEEFSEVARTVDPEFLGEKKGPQIWHWAVVGTKERRIQWLTEYLWYTKKKTKISYQIRIIDWRKSPDLTDPDLVAFIEAALGKDEEDDGKKKKRGGKKKR